MTQETKEEKKTLIQVIINLDDARNELACEIYQLKALTDLCITSELYAQCKREVDWASVLGIIENIIERADKKLSGVEGGINEALRKAKEVLHPEGKTSLPVLPERKHIAKRAE